MFGEHGDLIMMAASHPSIVAERPRCLADVAGGAGLAERAGSQVVDFAKGLSMLQSGFAIFFLLAMLLALVSMTLSLRDNLDSILAALEGVAPDGAALDGGAPPEGERAWPQASMRERPTAELPHVARRLGSLVEDDLAPVAETPRIWAFRRDPALSRAA